MLTSADVPAAGAEPAAAWIVTFSNAVMPAADAVPVVVVMTVLLAVEILAVMPSAEASPTVVLIVGLISAAMPRAEAVPSAV